MTERVERRVSGISIVLTYAGKLELIKSLVFSMSMFLMGTFDVPLTINGQVSKFISHCLWTKNDSKEEGSSLIAWK
jgi:hypothetical protein